MCIHLFAGVNIQRLLDFKLLDFKLPDIFVWIGMVAFLGAILDWKGQSHSVNILNVCIVLFFLQGLAVLEYFYKTLRVGLCDKSPPDFTGTDECINRC